MTANHRPLEESDIELIERIRSTPCLYDTKDPDFRLVYKKEQQWQTVAEGLAMSHWEARKRWTVLRDRYARELKQLLLHPDSMEYGKNEFFHRMDFLRNFVKKRSVRKKCNSSSSHSEDMMMKKSTGQEEDDEDNDVNKSIPIKIFKVDNNVSSFESHDNRVQQHQQQQQQTQHIYKSYIIDEDMMMKKSSGQVVENEEDEVNKAIPVKIFKVDNNVSSFETYDNPEQQHHRQLPQHQPICKSYIIDDSQDSTTTGRYSYIEQEANNADSNHVDEQEYHDYVEDTSAAYEAVDEDQETESPHYVSNRSMSTATVDSSNSNKIITNTSFTTAATENKLNQLPQLQQRPSNDTICTHTITTMPNEPSDSEEYFSKTIALYLKQLSRRYKIKAKVEMMQILEKYIELEETKDNCK